MKPREEIVVEHLRVRPVSTKRGVFVSKEFADATKKFLEGLREKK
jgi:hypothetical protein